MGNILPCSRGSICMLGAIDFQAYILAVKVGISVAPATALKQNKNKTKAKNDRKKVTVTQSTCQKKIEERHSMERVWFVQAASHPKPSPDRNHAPKRKASTENSVLSGLQIYNYRHSRRRLGSPRVGPINAALKRLELATTVTPGAASAGVWTSFPYPSSTRP